MNREERLAEALEALHAQYNRPELIHPDPLEVVREYPSPADREVAALVAALLAYGGVKQIVRSVREALTRFPSPAGSLRRMSEPDLRKELAGFKHRFATGDHLAALLFSVEQVREEHGSLKACFLKGLQPDDPTVLPALDRFVQALCGHAGARCGHLLPHPERGSACKRLCLFLRWLVRCDGVDPGGWEEAGKHRLIVPMDTHMRRMTMALGLTQRKTADMTTALDVTAAFRAFAPEDPVKYDFSLTRLGIRHDADFSAFLREAGLT